MKAKLLLIILVYCCFCSSLRAQEVPPIDSLAAVVLDSLGLPIPTDLLKKVNELGEIRDTIPNRLDSLARSTSFSFDSLSQANTTTTTSTFTASSSKVAYSTDSLDQEVESYGKDSMRYDIANKEIHLWGDAYVIYGDIKLEADYIIYNWTDNIVTAQYSENSLGAKSGLPKFTDKDQDFTAEKMRFNFKTKKGVVEKAVSNQSGMVVHGGRAKIFSEGSDSIQQHQHIYSKDALFTTCNHPEPHFGIHSRKQVMTNDVIVVGPSNIELGGVPTPLWLPFGVFPLKLGERTGLIFPKSYEQSDQLGFGLENVGWYFAINDYMNLTITGKIYTRGTWGLNATTQYKKLYKYNGNLSLRYANQRVEKGNGFARDKSFSVNWTHKQDTKAHPTMTFGGGINFQTNDFQSRNFNDAESAQQNTTRSNLNFIKTFPDKPFTFSASFNHSQITTTRAVQISFPNLDFRMRRIFPFKSKSPIADEKWYDKIGIDYHGQAQNRFVATDTTVFTQQTLDDARFGAKHETSANASFRVLKYFNLSPNISYTEVWNFKTVEKFFDPTLEIDTMLVDTIDMIYEYDTIAYGSVIDGTKNGFKPLRMFNTGVTLNTKLFGTMLFKRGWLRGLRHTATPSLTMSYTPDYTTDVWDYFKTVRASLLTNEQGEYDEEMYSIFPGDVYSNQPSSAGEQFNLSYGLVNIFEGKYFSKKDSTFQRFKIFDSVGLRGSRNFAKDTMQWSTITMNGRASIIPQLTTLTLNATFDPYQVVFNDSLNRRVRVDQLVWKDRKRLARFDRASAGVTTRFTIRKLVDMISGNDKKKGKSSERSRGDQGPQGIANQSFLSLIDNFSISHDIKFQLESIGAGDTARDTFTITTHSLTLRGNIKLTDKWSVNLSQSSYNFKQKRLVYPSLGLARDLHCWRMQINWYPSRNSFNFSLNVKPGALDFIKVPYGRNQFDGQSIGQNGF
ncbi:MAG: hypothetical protein ACJATF_001316 [Flavobacteriales bacterium]